MPDANGRSAFLPLARKVFDASDPFWAERRKFSKWEAWVDLVQLAHWRPRDWVVGTEVFPLSRGETQPLSRVLLEGRWRWGAKAVRRYLATLHKMARLRPGQETPQGSTYVLVNYDTYNPQGPSEDIEKGQAETHSGAKRGPIQGPSEDPGNDPHTEEVKKQRSKTTDMSEMSAKGDGFDLRLEVTVPRSPITDIWSVFIEELGGSPPYPRLTDVRKKKLLALYDEHLKKLPNPAEAFRLILLRVKASEFHMNTRAFQMPESLFRNEDRRDKWASAPVLSNGNGHHQPAQEPIWIDEVAQ